MRSKGGGWRGEGWLCMCAALLPWPVAGGSLLGSGCRHQYQPRLILQAWLPGLGQSYYLATEATVRREGHSFCSHPGAMWVLEPSPFPAMPTPRPSTGTNHTAILPRARWPLTACHLLAASAGLGELGHRACASHTEGTCAQTRFTEQLRALGNLF